MGLCRSYRTMAKAKRSLAASGPIVTKLSGMGLGLISAVPLGASRLRAQRQIASNSKLDQPFVRLGQCVYRRAVCRTYDKLAAQQPPDQNA